MDLKEIRPHVLREVTKYVSRDAEKIARDKLNALLAEGNSDQTIELDFRHNFTIKTGESAEITFETTYDKIQGEQRERVRGYSYRNKNGRTVNVKAHNRVNKDTRKFQTEDGKFTTTDEIPNDVFVEIFTEAVEEALFNAFQNLKS